jgi:hypothetical protein
MWSDAGCEETGSRHNPPSIVPHYLACNAVSLIASTTSDDIPDKEGEMVAIFVDVGQIIS